MEVLKVDIDIKHIIKSVISGDIVVGDTINGDIVNYVSIKKGKKGKIKSLSVYLLRGNIIIRISDHWSDSDYNPNIYPTLKCGLIGKNRILLSAKGLLMDYKGFIAGGINAAEWLALNH